MNGTNGFHTETSILGSTGEVFMPRTAGAVSALEIEHMDLPPLQWIIPDILPEGLSILAAPPKAGKSYLALDAAMAVAGSGKVFGNIECETGDVLYLALEDGVRRLQSRMRQLRPLRDIPARLHFRIDAPRLSDGLIGELEEWIDAVEQPRLIIIDTWRTVKPEAQGRGSAYDEDAHAISPIHELAKRNPGLAVLVVHHTRKLETSDSFASISGSYGLTGVADTLLVLQRHGADGHKLCVRGREVEDAEKELQRNRTTGGWELLGDARALAKTQERQDILDVLEDAAEEGATLTPAQIVTATGKKRENIQFLLKKLLADGQVVRRGHGKYTIADTHSHRSLCSLSEGKQSERLTSDHSHRSLSGDDADSKSEQSEQSERTGGHD